MHSICQCLAEEEQQRIEREEQERKAREEAEKQKIEVAERLKKEEKEREERRKRVEAIMSRTRAKNAAANNQASAGSNKVTIMLCLYFIFFLTNCQDILILLFLFLLLDFQAENETGSNGSNSPSSAEAPSQPTQNDEMSANNTKNSIGDYEKSVTDKENALFHTFNNKNENKFISTTTPTPPQSQPQLHADNNGLHNNLKTNGKLIDFTLNEEQQPPISNGNGHTLINSFDNNKM